MEAFSNELVNSNIKRIDKNLDSLNSSREEMSSRLTRIEVTLDQLVTSVDKITDNFRLFNETLNNLKSDLDKKTSLYEFVKNNWSKAPALFFIMLLVMITSNAMFDTIPTEYLKLL